MEIPLELTGPDDRIVLRRGVAMPRLGFGTYKAMPDAEAEHAVTRALEVGYRGIDTASMYGNEAAIGRAISRSGLRRQDIFVATKVWNDEQGYDATLLAMERSLERLGMDYVDLYLIHWPVASLLHDTWRAMQRLLEERMTRSIGVCNFLEHHLDALLAAARTPPAVDQIEFHPRLQQPSLLARCEEHRIGVQAWAPIMRGRVGDIPALVEIGRAHGKTPAQVTIRWILQLGLAALPKSVRDDRIRENADVYDFTLDAEEMALIGALDTGERLGPHPDRFAK